MADFVELWVYLSATPLFGLTATLTVYLVAQAIYLRVGQAPWANPVLLSIIILGGGLSVSGVSYQTYFAGAQFIHFLLGPAVVALAWPLWLRRAELLARWRRLLLASLAGGAVASVCGVVLGMAVGLPDDVVRSLAPKSVTAPVAMGVADRIGGVPALAAVFAVITGLTGALSGKYLFDLMGLRTDADGYIDRGFALGTVSHGIGAARALQVDGGAGAFAGLALGVQVVIASLLMPLLYGWVFG
ncbi:MAG: LrgB family protein [Burkholderiaceae bacterium]